MRKNKKLLAIAAVLFCTAVLAWLSASTQAKQKTDNSINDSYNVNVEQNYKNIKKADFSKHYSSETNYNNQTDHSDQRVYHNQRNFNGSKYYSVATGPGLLGYPYGENQAVDGYERLLDRYIDMNEKDLAALNTDLKTIIKKLDTINAQLRKLNARVTKIEKALNVTSQTTQKKN